MPLYDFRCTKCDKDFEALVSGPEEAGVCPQCNDSEYVVREVSAPGGYQMDSGPSSIRPKGAGSFRR